MMGRAEVISSLWLFGGLPLGGFLCRLGADFSRGLEAELDSDSQRACILEDRPQGMSAIRWGLEPANVLLFRMQALGHFFLRDAGGKTKFC